MTKSIKQIYASLELCENDLRILVAEYYNTRFNILRVDRIQSKALRDFKIVDRELLINDIQRLVSISSNKLNSKIEQVILVLPAYGFKRFPLRSNIVTTNGIVTKSDISRAISNSLRAPIDNDSMIVSSMISKYTINDISTRRMPENEVCDELFVDIDLLCADKDICIDYVSVVEESGLKVLDIVLNTYAVGKEASLIEESLKQNVVCLDINRDYTYLTLFSKGKLASCEILYDGLGDIAKAIKNKYDIPNDDLYKLIKYSINYQTSNPEDIVYAYNHNDFTKTVTIGELNGLSIKPLQDLNEKLITMCKPIIEKGALLYVTGEGQQMKCLIDLMKDSVDCQIKSYYPDTIGVKDPTLVSLYGSLFVYKDKAELNNLNVNCIDLII